MVAYDDAGGTIAARLWWMLDDLGHPRRPRPRRRDRGLDGRRRPAHAEVPAPVPGQLSLRVAWTRVIDRDALVARLLAGDVTLLDARAPERYRGEVEPVDPVPGTSRAPAAARARATWRRTAASSARTTLRVRLGGLGADVVTSCGSGVTACHTALAMRVAGLPDPILYPGSYSDWSRAGMPVATGDEPGRYEG